MTSYEPLLFTLHQPFFDSIIQLATILQFFHLVLEQLDIPLNFKAISEAWRKLRLYDQSSHIDSRTSLALSTLCSRQAAIANLLLTTSKGPG
jgi:hypothetical protein